jgi:hypothetical protein
LEEHNASHADIPSFNQLADILRSFLDGAPHKAPGAQLATGGGLAGHWAFMNYVRQEINISVFIFNK